MTAAIRARAEDDAGRPRAGRRPRIADLGPGRRRSRAGRRRSARRRRGRRPAGFRARRERHPDARDPRRRAHGRGRHCRHLAPVARRRDRRPVHRRRGRVRDHRRGEVRRRSPRARGPRAWTPSWCTAASRAEGAISWADWLAAAPPVPADAGQRPPRPVLVYTSGTTGRARGAVVRWTTALPETADDYVAAITAESAFPPGPHLVVGPLQHNAPLTSVRHLLAGQPVIIVGKFDAETHSRADRGTRRNVVGDGADAPAAACLPCPTTYARSTTCPA